MTYLPTKFTIVLGRDDDVRHAGLWYMHLVRFGHGKFLIVSAADLQKHDRDTHAAVYISQTSHHAHAERLLFDTGNKFGHVWADMGDVNGFSPNTGDVLASQRRFTLANGDAGGASCQFESILYAEPSIPLHTVTNYGIAMAPRTLVCALQPGATAPFTSENLAPPAKTDTDVIAACFADTVIGSGVPNITNAGREPFVISIDSAPGYDSPAVNALVDGQLTPELCSAIRATYRGGKFRSNRELRDAYGHLGKRHMKWLFSKHKDLGVSGLRAGDCDCELCELVKARGTHTPSAHKHVYWLAPKAVGSVWYIDTYSWSDEPDIHGNHTGIKMMDARTTVVVIYPLPDLKHHFWPAMLKHEAMVRSFGYTLECIYMDRDTIAATNKNFEMKTKSAQDFELQTKSRVQFIPPHSQHLNHMERAFTPLELLAGRNHVMSHFGRKFRFDTRLHAADIWNQFPPFGGPTWVNTKESREAQFYKFRFNPQLQAPFGAVVHATYDDTAGFVEVEDTRGPGTALGGDHGAADVAQPATGPAPPPRLRDLALSTRIKVQQHNPKRGASRTRYDGYKSATTIDEFLRWGA